MVSKLLDEAGVTSADIDRIGVTVGPGSFTGLRVGLAFAKGLALALDRPCVAIGTLAALAAGIEAGGPIAAAIDAGRGRVYLQMFEGATSIGGPDIVDIDLAIARLVETFPSGRATVTGPGAALLQDALPDSTAAPQDVPDPRAVALLAARAPLVTPRPLYLRPADAKVKSA
jgi:tRNA threonylcarbamoyladenosine biosynthesis protein TsaB